jgi:hypothetical protein
MSDSDAVFSTLVLMTSGVQQQKTASDLSQALSRVVDLVLGDLLVPKKGLDDFNAMKRVR